MAYLDHNGAARGDAGEFAGLPGASGTEQIAAGVGPYDTIESASCKVADRRRGFQAGQPSATVTGGNEGLLGEALWGLCKWLLLPAAAILIPLCAAWSAIDSAESRHAEGRAGGGLGRLAAAHAFPGESLSPASRYARAPDIGIHAPGATPRLTSAQAYACQLEPKCAQSPAADALHAASMLAALARGGDETAARDLCLLPLLAGSHKTTVDQARFYCAMALRAKPESAEARRISSALNGSLWMWAADFAQRAQAWDPAR